MRFDHTITTVLLVWGDATKNSVDNGENHAYLVFNAKMWAAWIALRSNIDAAH